MLLMLGARWWFTFDEIQAEWAVTAHGVVGVNNLTADMGALFLGTAALIAIGIFRKTAEWLLAAALLMGLAALGRVYAFLTVGYDQTALVPLIVEVVMVIVLSFTARRFSAV